MTEKIKPGRGGYVVAAVILLVGCGFAAMSALGVLMGLTDELTQVVVPGEETLTFAEPGDYTIFYEYESVVGDQVFSTGDLNGINIQLISAATGQPVELSEKSTELSYEVGGRAGESLAAFTIQEPGDYNLAAGYPEGQEGQPIVLAVGFDEDVDFLGPILISVAIGGISLMLALLVGVRTLVKRRRAIEQRNARPVGSQEPGGSLQAPA